MIGDRVWADTDGEGDQDHDEHGVAGVWVQLLDGGTVTAETHTDQYGDYSFGGLDLNHEYRIRFIAPAGATFTQPYATEPERDSNPDPDGYTGSIVLTAGGESNLSIDAGLLMPSEGARGTVGDRVWSDPNKDGVQDPGEPGIPHVQVD